MINNIIIYIINIIHFIIVFFIFASPFIPTTNNIFFRIKLSIYVLLIFLVFQYLSGFQRCGLTEFEYYIKGEKYKEGYIHRLIKPIITIPENYLDKYLYIIHLILILILSYQLNVIKYIKTKFIN